MGRESSNDDPGAGDDGKDRAVTTASPLPSLTRSWCRVWPVCEPERIRPLCRRPYLQHPKGCPNFGQRDICPPQAPLLGDVLDLDSSVWAVYNVFPLAEHVCRMRLKHPDWSRAQLYCCLYWQGTARKQLRASIEAFLLQLPCATPKHIVMCPEACGCNVTETMKRVGIELEWPPKQIVYQIALAGLPVGGRGKQ